ncbi:MAG: right-handed parallel beta-helix repeat-containing protein [Spirochaetota bacterium]
MMRFIELKSCICYHLFMFTLTPTYSPLFCKTYYISQMGSNSYSGTQKIPNVKQDDGPWKDFSKLTQRGVIQAGDRILVKRGDVWRNLHDIRLRISGKKEKPISIASYGNGKKPTLHFQPKVAGLYLHNYGNTLAHISIKDLHLEGNGSGFGVFLSHDKKGGKTSYIKCIGLDIHNFSIGLHSQANSHISIRYSNIHHNGTMGILGGVISDTLHIENNLIFANGAKCPRQANIYCHNIYLSYGRNIHITSNTIYQGSNFGIIVHGQVSDLYIRKNNIFANHNGIGVDPGYVQQAENFYNVIIENNYIHNNSGSWILSFQSIHHLRFRYNVIQNQPYGNIVIRKRETGDAKLEDVEISHNIFLGIGKLFHIQEKVDKNKWKIENNWITYK